MRSNNSTNYNNYQFYMHSIALQLEYKQGIKG